jgi:hypothetical protein
MKRSSQKTPESLKQVERKLRGLRKSRAHKINLFGVRRRLKTMNKADDLPAADQWVDTHREDWIAKAKSSHDGVLEDLNLLEIRVDEIQAGYEVELEHHRDVVSYLRAAVTHAWDRISDPESPYYDPRVRRRHGDLS